MTELPRKFTALVTPFLPDGTVDYNGFRENIRYQLSEGWAPVVLGTTGEAPTIEPDEFKKIVQAAVEETAGRLPVMVGTGSNNTRATVEKTRLAKELGADLALVVMPYYNKPEPAGQEAHFRAVAEVMPIVMYDIMGRTGRAIDYEVIQWLAEYPNVAGYKAATHNQKAEESCGLSERVAQELSAEDFRVWSGDDGRTLDLMQHFGAYGVISVASNVLPREVGRLVDAAAAEDFQTAAEINVQLDHLFKALFRESNPIPVKAAMNLLHETEKEGMHAGAYRLPMTPPREATITELKQVLNNLGLLEF